MLSVRGLVKHYASPDGEPIRAVDEVSFTLDAGELAAIFGPSGSGKTTLLKLIAAVTKPDRGEILVNGRDIARLNGRDAARYRLCDMGFVSQTFHFIPSLSAIDNAIVRLLGTGLDSKKAQQQITPLLARLDVDAKADTRIGKLSTGEQQRVAIARALSTDPALLLADEPTGNLDTKRGKVVLALLREVCRERGTAVVLVTHDPQALSCADRAYALRDGKLSEHEPRDAISAMTTAEEP